MAEERNVEGNLPHLSSGSVEIDSQMLFVNFTSTAQRPSHETSKRMRIHVMKKYRHLQREERRKNGPRIISRLPSYVMIVSHLNSQPRASSVLSPTVKALLEASPDPGPDVVVYKHTKALNGLVLAAQIEPGKNLKSGGSIRTWLDGSLEPFQVLPSDDISIIPRDGIETYQLARAPRRRAKRSRGTKWQSS